MTELPPEVFRPDTSSCPPSDQFSQFLLYVFLQKGAKNKVPKDMIKGLC